ncbi:hypothetical protein [Candidatus Poriferisocius sp.]
MADRPGPVATVPMCITSAVSTATAVNNGTGMLAHPLPMGITSTIPTAG